MKQITIDPKTAIPKAVADACAKLRATGAKAWLAGGCVRDMILGVKPRDWDIVTDATLSTCREVFPKHLEVGAAFGILKLTEKLEGDAGIDVAIFRKESGYSDKRHPDVVEPGDENTDAARRDFTINALYFDPQAKLVYDYIDGYKDIAGKTIRTVGPAKERFSEDALRILRAARFSAQLGFKIEAETLTAMKTHSKLLTAISRERIREETFRLLSSPRPIQGLETLAKAALWEQVFGVKKTQVPADFRSLKFIETPTPLSWLCALGVSGLLGDVTKDASEITERLTDFLRLSNDERRVLSRMLSVFDESKSPRGGPQEWIDIAREHKSTVEMTRRFIKRARGVDIEDKERATRFLEQVERWSMKKNSEKALPASADLIKEGLKAGPKLGAELKKRQWTRFWANP